MKNQTINLFVFSGVRVGQILDPIILANLRSALSNVLFLVIAIYAKGLSVLIFQMVISIFLVMLYLTRMFFRSPHLIQMPALDYNLKSCSCLIKGGK